MKKEVIFGEKVIDESGLVFSNTFGGFLLGLDSAFMHTYTYQLNMANELWLMPDFHVS